MNQQYPQQPPQPQPPKKNSTGKIVGLGCLGVVALFVLIGIVGAVAGGGDGDGTDGKNDTAASAGAAPGGKEKQKEEEEGEAKPKTEAPDEGPVKITAKTTPFAKTVLADGTGYTSVRVTITNSGDDTIDVNPLYFTITDTGGTKHTAELGVDENQIDTVHLAPGENTTGSVTGKGTFTPEYVTYTDGLLGDPLRVDVS
ncbi:DUF4352 domain-containing protein [Streptomyces fumanus]|uniref:DUF4352 domain-containing protein n=1 Tax=Streptomyces fumanus TaxID=67302 RepID=A0A919AJ26_9ACTN|nr:DUF4352 domain-containing protein [Streptomyces fumanus]GHF12337.1 hypothetical protein GCM10018772_41840 [Streptomyces fumanus]